MSENGSGQPGGQFNVAITSMASGGGGAFRPLNGNPGGLIGVSTPMQMQNIGLGHFGGGGGPSIGGSPAGGEKVLSMNSGIGMMGQPAVSQQQQQQMAAMLAGGGGGNSLGQSPFGGGGAGNLGAAGEDTMMGEMHRGKEEIGRAHV